MREFNGNPEESEDDQVFKRPVTNETLEAINAMDNAYRIVLEAYSEEHWTEDIVRIVYQMLRQEMVLVKAEYRANQLNGELDMKTNGECKLKMEYDIKG